MRYYGSTVTVVQLESACSHDTGDLQGQRFDHQKGLRPKEGFLLRISTKIAASVASYYLEEPRENYHFLGLRAPACGRVVF